MLVDAVENFALFYSLDLKMVTKDHVNVFHLSIGQVLHYPKGFQLQEVDFAFILQKVPNLDQNSQDGRVLEDLTDLRHFICADSFSDSCNEG
jgi:hypothetical protein